MAFSFKAMVEADRRRTFLNLDEFGEKHTVEGRAIAAVLDDNALKERQGGQELSVAESSLLLYAAVEDLPARRPAGEGLNVDGREYIVNDWSEDRHRGPRPDCHHVGGAPCPSSTASKPSGTG